MTFDEKTSSLIKDELKERMGEDALLTIQTIIDSLVFHAVQASIKTMPTRKLSRERMKREVEKAFNQWDAQAGKEENNSRN